MTYILISTKEQLQSIQAKGCYKLTNDIDMQGEEGPNIECFRGKFDGQGYTISNLTIDNINDYASVGLFQRISGSESYVANLTLDNMQIIRSDASNIGFICGRLLDGAVIDNCVVKNSIFTDDNTSTNIGGICGEANSMSGNFEPVYIQDCSVINCEIFGSGITASAVSCLIHSCVVETTTLLNTHSASAIAYRFYYSQMHDCIVRDCHLRGSTEQLNKENISSKIEHCQIIMPEVKTPQLDMRAILQSDSAYEQLKDQQSLSLWGLFTDEPVPFPDVICQLTQLKTLNIGNNAWLSIPDNLLNLVNLEELQLDGALGYIEQLPDLSKLKQLKHLRANGDCYQNNCHYPKIALLEQLLRANQVEKLNIEKWGAVFNYNELIRPPLTAILLTKLKQFKQLKYLNLTGNKLTELPAEILPKGKLYYVNLQKNDLTPRQLAHLNDLRPDVIFDVDKINSDYLFNQIINYPELSLYDKYQITNYNLLGLWQGTSFRPSDRLKTVLKEYEKDTENNTSFKSFYNKIAIASCCFCLVNCDTANKKTKEKYIKLTFEAFLPLLRDMQQQSTAHVDEITYNLQTILLFFVGNGLAEHFCFENDDPQLFAIGLEITSLIISRLYNKDEHQTYYTHVKLLLNLGREDEAYSIVNWALPRESFRASINYFSKSEDYKNWLTANKK